MCIQDQKCCAFLSLHSMGIPTQGCLYDVAWIRSIELPVSPSATCFVSLPHRTITFLQTIAQGSFGFIDRARYEEEGKDLYVKRPIRPGTKLLLEACVQQLVGELLTRHGWPHRVPAVRSGVCSRGPRVYPSTMWDDVAVTSFSRNEPSRCQAEQSHDSSGD